MTPGSPGVPHALNAPPLTYRLVRIVLGNPPPRPNMPCTVAPLRFSVGYSRGNAAYSALLAWAAARGPGAIVFGHFC